MRTLRIDKCVRQEINGLGENEIEVHVGGFEKWERLISRRSLVSNCS